MNARDRKNYERGAVLTHEIVRNWRKGTPKFAFPPRDIALIADLRDIGKRLARNAAALELVEALITICVATTGQAPTAMMLRVVLEEEGHAIEWVSPSELGLAVPQS